MKVLKPLIVKPEPVSTPQCCVEVTPPTHAPHWRRDRYKITRPSFNPDRCQRESLLEYEGKNYCKIHAGQLALEMWLSGKLKEAS